MAATLPIAACAGRPRVRNVDTPGFSTRCVADNVTQFASRCRLGGVADGTGKARTVTHALFNNRAFADVAVAAHRILEAAPKGTVTTRQVAAATGFADSVVRPVMVRLAAAGLLRALPKHGAANSTQLYLRADDELWRRLMALLDHAYGVAPDALHGPG